MALPPRGDLRRRMHLAIRSMWVLGSLLLLIGLCGIGGSLFSLAGRSPVPPGVGVMQLVGSTIYWAPGVLYVVFAVYLKRRQLWAVVGGLILASIQFLFLLTGLVVMIAIYFSPDSSLPPPFLIAVGVMALFVLALAQLVYYLARSFQAIREPPYGREEHGFEPVMAVSAFDQPAAGNLPIQPGATAGDSDATSPPR